MDTICLDDVKSIIKKNEGAHVSIFMPTHHRGGADQQDPIRLRNLLRTAEEKLSARGMRLAEARTMLKPSDNLITDNLFWRQQSDGLALFIDSNSYLYYRVPIILKEEVGVGDRYYIKPLVSLLSNCGWFYILALSQDEVRLLQCTNSGSVRINLKEIPRSKAEALRLETPDNRVQYPVPAPAGGSNLGRATAVQQGEGNRPNYTKRNILRFFDQVSKGVQKTLKEDTAPLVLAGVDYLHPIYRESNLYRNLLPEGIIGNPNGVSDKTLREQAWSIVKPYFERTQREAIADFNKLAGTGLTATGLTDVIPAAYHGRVRFLFITENIQQWGRFNIETDLVMIHKNPQNDDEDLIDLAAFQTLNHAGTIYVTESSQVPGGAPVSAILRF